MNVGRGKIGGGMVLCQGVNLRAMPGELNKRNEAVYRVSIIKSLAKGINPALPGGAIDFADFLIASSSTGERTSALRRPTLWTKHYNFP
jgi:hypothetical protein